MGYTNLFIFISEHKGFGINTDIFETNVLNLSVVLGFLFFYGKKALSDIVISRRETILKNIQEAEIKFKEAENSLLIAKNNLNNAVKKAEDIRFQGLNLSKQTKLALLESIKEDIKRIKNENVSILKFEEGKAINEVFLKLNNTCLEIAMENISKKLTLSFQKKIILKNINKLSLNSL